MLVDHLAELLIPISSLAHVLIAPHTKVEESFTLHAVRDLLLKGISKDAISQYDHVEFPGAVPRSFIGPGLLSGLSYPFVRIASEFGLLRTGSEVQILIRLVLALASSLSLVFLARRVRYAFGAKLARAFILITATQFHLPFWISRTVPNMIAFPLVQIAIALLITPPTISSTKPISKLPLVAFVILAFTTITLRLELGALVVAFALEQLVRGTVAFFPLVTCGIISTVASLACTVVVDSYFWQKPTDSYFWPEGSSFFFNVVQGKASDWGTSPFYSYFALTLPKLLLLAFPFSLFSLFVDRRARRVGVPALFYIVVLSCLEHKEWRFISYVVPALNVCTASGIQAVGALFASKKLRRSCLLAIVALNLLFTLLGVLASSNNYPGGEAIAKLESLIVKSGRTDLVSVHVSPHTAMNGATNFLLHDTPLSSTASSAWYLSHSVSSASLSPAITYSKSESPTLDSASAFAKSPDSFDYLLIDATEAQYPEVWTRDREWKVVEETKGFAGFGKFWRNEKFGTKEKKSVGILERVR
ncbi:hypothetical protein JCM3765_006163 [Sporobolomyces pararoseus]